jgi:hypothetical protein
MAAHVMEHERAPLLGRDLPQRRDQRERPQ